MKEIFIVIPSLDPKPDLCRYAAELRRKTSGSIIVVDDGSGPDAGHVFLKLEGIPGCTVLRHRKNRGKGAALKTGFSHIRQCIRGEAVILCADSDGQHDADDVIHILKEAKNSRGTLILGTRDFTADSVPFRSRAGNRISALLYLLACGIRVEDTQTGLRAFDGHLLDFMCRIRGERFEYETRMLLECGRKGIPIRSVPIRTIYIDGNAGSHFQPVRDSLRVLSVLFSGLIRFGAASFFCAFLDLSLFLAAEKLLAAWGIPGRIQRIAAATVFARTGSGAVNFLINRKYVFGCAHRRNSLIRYFALGMGLSCLSSAGVWFFSRVLNGKIPAAKVLTDTVLFFISFRVQDVWVFSRKKDKRSSAAEAG